ncbi:MAG: flagellar assembly protein FliW [Lachnospiraceae bacterium]|nr:flagellar assembly protein FliW [Lachnospiraceae bacterium]
MVMNTRLFGEVTIDDNKMLHFPGGIVGFPDLQDFALIHDAEQGEGGGIHWMQSVQEPNFAMPVIDPLRVKPDYDPIVEDELLSTLGEIQPNDVLVLVTITVPSDLTKMTVNLKAPFIINVATRKACQVIVEDYEIKFPVYDILQKMKKEGE